MHVVSEGSTPAKPASAKTSSIEPARPARALSALYASHWAEIVGYIRQNCGPGPPDPEDAAQAAFTQFAALEDPQTVENPRAFLFRSARNHVIDYKRKEAVRRREQLTLIVGIETADHLDAQRVLEAKERVEILNSVLAKLSQRHRDVLVMHKVEGMTFDEISKRLGFSPSLAKKLAYEALTKCDRAMRRVDRR